MTQSWTAQDCSGHVPRSHRFGRVCLKQLVAPQALHTPRYRKELAFRGVAWGRMHDVDQFFLNERRSHFNPSAVLSWFLGLKMGPLQGKYFTFRFAFWHFLRREKGFVCPLNLTTGRVADMVGVLFWGGFYQRLLPPLPQSSPRSPDPQRTTARGTGPSTTCIGPPHGSTVSRAQRPQVQMKP